MAGTKLSLDSGGPFLAYTQHSGMGELIEKPCSWHSTSTDCGSIRRGSPLRSAAKKSTWIAICVVP